PSSNQGCHPVASADGIKVTAARPAAPDVLHSPTPMQYRHVFHAGNFADVHKHVALLQLLSSLQKKDKGFLFFDTHAGEGVYDLGSSDARHSAEGEAGILRLEAALATTREGIPPAIRHYLDAVQGIRQAAGNGRL